MIDCNSFEDLAAVVLDILEQDVENAGMAPEAQMHFQIGWSALQMAASNFVLAHTRQMKGE